MYKENISKEDVNKLKLQHFDGGFHVIDTIDKLRQIMPEIREQTVLGFDTETRPSFKKGQNNTVSLLQLATVDKAYLIRLNIIGLPDELVEILANPNYIKVGVAIKDDVRHLCQIKKFKGEGFIELQDYVKEFNIKEKSLKKLTAIVLGFRISKSQRLSNWDAEELTEGQLRYAATDAWAPLLIFQHLETGL